MQRVKLPQIQGFYLSLTLKDSSLAFEIEEESSGEISTLDLQEDSIDQVTDGLFQTSEELFLGLLDGANCRCPGITLSLSKGKLTYTVVFSTNTVQRYSFTLNLAEKRMDQAEALEKKLEQWKEKYEADTLENLQKNLQNMKDDMTEKLYSFRADINQSKVLQETNLQTLQERSEEKFDSIENKMVQIEQRMTQFVENLVTQMEQRLTQRLDFLEKTYEALKTSISLKSDFHFSMGPCYDPFYEKPTYDLSNHYKTATSLTGAYPCLKILPQIPLSGQHCFSLRLNKMRGGFCCGITTEKGKLRSAFDLNEFSYEYWTLNGRISGRISKRPIGDGPFGEEGSILKMIIDMDQGTLTFIVDNQQVNSCSISNSENYFAYVSLEKAGDSITLL